MKREELIRRIAIARDHDDGSGLLEFCVKLDLLAPQAGSHLLTALDLPEAERADWARWRFEALTARDERKQQAEEARRAGIDRFLADGQYGLDELTEPERARREAVWEAAGRGPITAETGRSMKVPPE